ncbi:MULTISPECIES: glycerol-3-phosphate 1-O-acyltransferase PlsY [Sphingobacterium]|jgi:glycerol-3-phosphate acyltransferase PlsY|uniref:glycerol-3-phosphate 1-O-acyltransferase PlsY n=1 Tax=Sphingobacterium TaxID=28453 RepID=UPI0004E5F3EE|nr:MULTISPECIES: glycerol-3-phosphate 1-O-acyltransferase PlsY [Sphingobacterium]CDS92520.1 Glycerol-3-phosphate acyltransferase [Sphingobacterium sp. PM2-P1-29]SJN43688.1 Acyl-phosphate:glycerol-3-phosphate O-acyltransferase PlsY [Sphingobacterium faecium PCAi_F2.5]UPZ35411.1 glycerol-3-phosphate 1-O-acyltransferase PlsY [Sphingobacterium sp. PCS056]UXD70967.1 glycerol-3-phosphate 1-O-acyltransferase PlsY [Sphingobacterium faecium]WGQ14638.1 glycerol-3-phosphate 1-O-acyltransferase PlsY [Sphi
MISIYLVSAVLLAYLFGSIPTAVWFGQAFYGVDVREYGSGNAGATNTFRVLGPKAGAVVMFVDIFKGFTSTNLAYLIEAGQSTSNVQFVNYQLALGVIAVLGHLFPVFAGFRGGKGVATLFGMILAIHAPAALLCVSIFIIILLTTHYVSLSSIMAGFTFPFSIAFLFKTSIPSVLLYGIAICALILITHQKNIERLLKGHESKVYLFKRKKNI